MDLSLLTGRRRRMLCRALMATLGRLVEIEGGERLGELGEPAIFALNHNNSFESLLVPTALIARRSGRLIHFLVDWMFLEIPLVGWMLRQCEPVPIYTKRARFGLREGLRRSRPRVPVLDLCLARLANGESLGIFPEGKRNANPDHLLRGRAGLAHLILRSGAPVVPVGIRYPGARRLGRAPAVGRIVLAIGEPLTFDTEREALAADPRRQLDIARQVVARTMQAISGLSGKSYRHHSNRHLVPAVSGAQRVARSEAR